jgi:DNA modification methylase
MVALKDLRAFEANARKHSQEQIAELARSIERFGFAAPVLIEADNTVIAGHGRLEAARLLELERVPAIRLDHLTPEQARALRLADNRLAQLSTWDEEQLAAELRTLGELNVELDGLGWSGDELEALFADQTGEEVAASDAKADNAERSSAPAAATEDTELPIPDAPETPTTQAGDVWTLGVHRVVCGDSLQGDAIEVALQGQRAAAIVTDPPYAIYGSSSGVSSSVTDDKIVRPFFRAVAQLAQNATAMFGHVYVFCDWRSWAAIVDASKGTRMEPKNLLVWDKGGAGLGSFYANTHELIGLFVNCPKQNTMRSSKALTGHRSVFHANILRAQRPRGDERLHNAAKPVELLSTLITNSTDAGDLVLDAFGGSGSTLIACEVTGRRCATVGVEPATVDIIVKRWQRRTGKAAVRVRDGKTFDEAAAEVESSGATS